MNRLDKERTQPGSNYFFWSSMSCCRSPTAAVESNIPDKFKLPMHIIQSYNTSQAHTENSKTFESIDELSSILLDMSDEETRELSYYAPGHPLFSEAIKTQQAVNLFSRKQQIQSTPQKPENGLDKSEFEMIVELLATNLCLKTALRLTRRHSLEILRTAGWLDITSYIAKLILEPLSEVKPINEILKMIEEESSEESKDKLKKELSTLAIKKNCTAECKEIIDQIQNPIIKDLAFHSAFTESLFKNDIPQAIDFLCRMKQIANLDNEMKYVKAAIEKRK